MTNNQVRKSLRASIFHDNEDEELESSILSSSNLTSTRSGIIQAVTTKEHNDLVAEREQVLRMAQEEEEMFNNRNVSRAGGGKLGSIFNSFTSGPSSGTRKTSVFSGNSKNSGQSGPSRRSNFVSNPLRRKTPAVRNTLYKHLSVSTEMAEFNKCAEHQTIHPLSKFRQYWDVISIAIIIQLCVQIPFQLAFHTEKDNYNSRNDIFSISVRMFTDLFFLVDLYRVVLNGN